MVGQLLEKLKLRRRVGQSPTRGEARPSLAVLLLLGIFPLLVLELVRIPVLERFEDAVSDARMRLRNRLDPRILSNEIRLVGVGDRDREVLDADLTSRQSYMELIQALGRYGARSVTFDVFFVAEQETDGLLAASVAAGSPPVVLGYNFESESTALEPQGELPAEFAELEQLSREGLDPAAVADGAGQLDGYLAELRGTMQRQRQGADPPLDSTEAERLATLTWWTRELRGRLLRRWVWLQHGTEATLPGEALPRRAADVRLLSPQPLLAAPHLGYANVEKGEEEVVRRVPLVYEWNGRLFPQLSLATALAWYEVPFSEVTVEWGEAIRFVPRRNGSGEVRIPIDRRGEYRVNFREGESFLARQPTVSAVLLKEYQRVFFDDGTPESFFRDRFVLVGEVISGGMATDVEPIPLQTQFPMVGLHANVLDNILRRDFLYEVPLWLRLLAVGFLGGLGGLLFAEFAFGVAARHLALLAGFYLLLQYLLFQEWGFVLPIVRPLFGFGVATVLFFGYVIVIKDRDRRLVRDVFLKSVSPRVGEEILRNFHSEAIWGAQREVTVLFIDIRGYTTLSEQHGPEVVLDLLDRFYDTVSEVVFRHDGQVNKFLGDAVLALFGALPEEPPDHAARGLRAAAEIQAAIRRFNDSEEVARLGVRLNTGAGVNTGMATVGLVGRRRIRIEYTALGDAVNVASRLQTNASEGEVIVAERTLEMLGGENSPVISEAKLHLSGREELRVKGRRQPIAAYRARLEGAPPLSQTSGEFPSL